MLLAATKLAILDLRYGNIDVTRATRLAEYEEISARSKVLLKRLLCERLSNNFVVCSVSQSLCEKTK